MKILTVVGARPQFVKAAVLSAELRRRPNCREVLVHTGQHYDFEMSQVFFDQLGMRQPDYELGVGSGTHGVQTGDIMRTLEPVVAAEKPDVLMVYGDTNSTLAGSLVGAKAHVPVAHVEAGLRSFNRAMPEEINRIVADHVSTLLFAPNVRAARQLASEGITNGIIVAGDLMIDLIRSAAASVPPASSVIASFGVRPGAFGVATIHRASNTDDEDAFTRIIAGLRRAGMPVVFPVHPRTAPLADKLSVGAPADSIIRTRPLPYLDMVALMREARVILTDSGGIQKEALALEVPCVTLREETEWVETLEDGWNRLSGTDPDEIARAARRPKPAVAPRPHYGDGHAARLHADALLASAQKERAAFAAS